MRFRVKSKIWIENEEGKLVIGSGRVKILEAILEVGSMNKAARKLRQPFRAVWGKIKSTEERCGFKIVESSSAGTTLTPEGFELLHSYNKFRRRCESFVNEQFDEVFQDPPGK
jgi:molybdate transport system regulatory protein